MIDTSILQGKKAAYFTLGCKLNFAETSSIGDALKRLGVQTAEEGEVADICVVNTCSVTEVADRKCRQGIRRMVKAHPGAFVVVTGCYAQLRPDDILEIDGVDLVVGTEQKGDIVNLIAQKLTERETVRTSAQLTVPTKDIRRFSPSCSRGDRTRYFLKVQDGCNYYCTYCTIPYARGRSRNGSIASMVEQARNVAEQGGKEIVITGVNIGDFGHSTGETFYDLVRALDKVEGIARYRISSIEPNLLTDEIIRYVATSRAFMPHFHIPLQSGSDEVLRLMRRKYDTAFFRQKIEHVKTVLPDAFIGVDVMVGCRGETDECFEQAYRFIESIDVSHLHVFTYSERPGTKALEIPYVVSSEQKHERSQRLLSLSERKTHDFYAQYIDKVRPVLLEYAPTNRPMHGFTDNYVKVELENHPLLDNAIVDVRLQQFTGDGTSLKGEILNG
ncbi:MAG: tRNA (N(6)-L-threonylcarbamoyladenosine(37)-C(2))-methylthiotransferase MtaB [Bacteroidaceae bacterium]|nr:tRNA (N(6)-L-threonylcarbamoyladenosine(37)-C(2))-methylthiotransferase MtaB [Bacteroidaceae bacterium]